MNFKENQFIIFTVFATFSASIFVEVSEKIGTTVFPLLLMLIAMTLDFITGLWAAPHRGEVITSKVFWTGIKKKGMMLMVLFAGVILDGVLSYTSQFIGMNAPGNCYVTLFVAAWLTINEILSLLENAQDARVNFPPFLKRITQFTKSSIEQKIEPKEEEEHAETNSSHQ